MMTISGECTPMGVMVTIQIGAERHSFPAEIAADVAEQILRVAREAQEVVEEVRI